MIAQARAVGRVPEAAARLAATAAWRLRRMLGLRRTVRVAGARYTERTAEPLHRALSRQGAGVKEYDAEFAGGPRMRIRATRARVYADLVRPPRLEAFEAAEAVVRPGMRVLVIEGGTGWAAERQSRLVGPSGAVVSLDRDEESAHFAQRRYRLHNTAFETGHVDSLKGETEGAFDTAIAIEAFAGGDELRLLLGELWRVVRGGGTLVVGARNGIEEDGTPARPSSSDLSQGLQDVIGDKAEIRDLGAPGGRWWIVAAVAPEA